VVAAGVIVWKEGTGMSTSEKNPEPQPKAEYHSPTLTVYGTIREITQTSGNRGRRDRGANNARTGF
jgi:hypothetical protein